MSNNCVNCGAPLRGEFEDYVCESCKYSEGKNSEDEREKIKPDTEMTENGGWIFNKIKNLSPL